MQVGKQQKFCPLTPWQYFILSHPTKSIACNFIIVFPEDYFASVDLLLGFVRCRSLPHFFPFQSQGYLRQIVLGMTEDKNLNLEHGDNHETLVWNKQITNIPTPLRAAKLILWPSTMSRYEEIAFSLNGNRRRLMSIMLSSREGIQGKDKGVRNFQGFWQLVQKMHLQQLIGQR